MAETGRGAFTHIGKDNGKSFYEFVPGEPQDGNAPEKGFNYEAVHLGVLSIEQRLVELGYDVIADGKFGRKARRAVSAFQSANGLTPSGAVGYLTGPVLWKPVIQEIAGQFSYDPAYIYGLMKQESGGDPGAVGYMHPPDRGLWQFNMEAHEDVTPVLAHDYRWACDAVSKRFRGAWKRFSGKGEELRINCSIAQHNAPAWAEEWYDNESPPNEQIADYARKVKLFALGF